MQGTALKIRLLGDPALKKKAKPIKQITQQHRDVLSMMARLMYDASGIGLAASQVGIDQAMLVVDIGDGLYKIINPKILRREGRQMMEEGCLSLPGVSIKVKRAKQILLNAQDENGRPLNIEAQDLLARVFQHEMDHLNGKLIIDYASWIERLGAKRVLAKLKESAKNETVPEPETKSYKLQL